jgi:DNA-directed RNA polymerase subunit RPC12/RpoP
MAEFKFSCPQCRQRIQCDSTYAGSQISCPSCQKSIVVPPMPPSVVPPEKTAVQIKKSTLKKAALIGLCVVLAAGIVAAPFYIFIGPKKVTFKAYVDGTDIIKLSGGRLWIEHKKWKLPAKMTVNGKNWNPIWDKKTSAPYQLSRSFKPGNPEDVKLTKNLGRGELVILEKPSSANHETLAVKINDGDFQGADFYEFTVLW